MFDIDPYQRKKRYNSECSLYVKGERSCLLSRDGHYRTRLREKIGPSKRHAIFVTATPGPADHERADPIWKKCIAFAKKWECGTVEQVSLFAYRGETEDDLTSVFTPEGYFNVHIMHMAAGDVLWHDGNGVGGVLVAAWGKLGGFEDQDIRIFERLKHSGIGKLPWQCLGLKDGFPKTLDEVRTSAKPQPFTVRIAA